VERRRRAAVRRAVERRRTAAAREAASRRAAAAPPQYPRLVVPALAPGPVSGTDDPATPRAVLAATGAILLALAGAGAMVVTRASREAQP
jgi:hypothetical protein